MMGFWIREVRISGENMRDATIKFGKGFSLLTGPSDTGKSFIVDAINHVFGSGTPLRDIAEKQHYDTVSVEICSFQDNNVFTLQRAWSGGDIRLYSSTLERAFIAQDDYQIIKSSHSPKGNSVSNFLLSLSDLDDKLIRKNSTGTTHRLSFRNLVKYTLISEERIITKLSPIFSGQNNDATKDKSLFNLMLSGIDDSSITASLSKNTKIAMSSGRNEVLDSFILEIQNRLVNVSRTIDQLKQDLLDYQQDLSNKISSSFDLKEQIISHHKHLQALSDERQQRQGRLEQVNELSKRFALLDQYYDNDIARLESTKESGSMLTEYPEGDCPLCGSPPASHDQDSFLRDEEIGNLVSACNIEIHKLILLKSDLKITLENLTEDYLEHSNHIRIIDNEIFRTNAVLRDVLQPLSNSNTEDIKASMENVRRIERSISDYDDLYRIQQLKDSFQQREKDSETSTNFSPIPVNFLDRLSQIIENILREWRYPDLDRVFFDIKENDIVINGKSRSSHGKGYRAITYSAFVIGLLTYCRQQNLPHPGFIILDSPLVTYRKPDETDDDLVDEGMIPAFYDYLSKLPEDYQIIVIENEEPEDYIKQLESYTHFTRNRAFGRYGFLHTSA